MRLPVWVSEVLRTLHWSIQMWQGIWEMLPILSRVFRIQPILWGIRLAMMNEEMTIPQYGTRLTAKASEVRPILQQEIRFIAKISEMPMRSYPGNQILMGIPDMRTIPQRGIQIEAILWRIRLATIKE
jgi:hypothetical protein